MELVREIQSEIEKRSLSGGGWASGDGRRAGIETTCYALMALRDRPGRARDTAIDLLLRTQNPDGSWPAFEGDDREGCWTTSLVVIALRFARSPAALVEKGVRWLLNNKGREGHWFWNWKFRTADRAVQFDPDKYGWPWFPGTVSWVIPTAFSLIALRKSPPCCRTESIVHRIQLGTEMLRDRVCPSGGWNAGNGVVFGAALNAHIDTTAIALLALAGDNGQASSSRALEWLRAACVECPSAYGLAWAAIALAIRQDAAAGLCLAHLRAALSATHTLANIETLSLAAIAISDAEGNANPFHVEI